MSRDPKNIEALDESFHHNQYGPNPTELKPGRAPVTGQKMCFAKIWTCETDALEPKNANWDKCKNGELQQIHTLIRMRLLALVSFASTRGRLELWIPSFLRNTVFDQLFWESCLGGLQLQM